MQKLFSFIFLVVTLLASTAVISATEANVHTGINAGQEAAVIAVIQEDLICNYDFARAQENEDQAGLEPGNSNASIEEEGAAGDTAEEEITDEESGRDDSYRDDNYNDAENNYIPDEGDTNDQQEDLPEEQEIMLPESPGYQDLTISNFPNTVMPAGQSPGAGPVRVLTGDRVYLIAGTVPETDFLGWAYYPVIAGEPVNFVSTDEVYTYVVGWRDIHIVAVWDKETDGLGVQQNTGIITVTNYPVTVMPIGQGPAGTIVVQYGYSINLFAGIAEGYTFSHWSYLSSDLYELNFENIMDPNTVFQANGGVITVIANWVSYNGDEGGQPIQVTFDPNGGTWDNGDSDPITIVFPTGAYICMTAGIPMPEVPVKPGYTFIGWNTQPDGQGEWFFGCDGGSAI